MKKIMYFLMGAGTVVAGFLAYAFLSDSPGPSKEITQEPQDPPIDPVPPRCSSQDYVARRREFMQRRASEQTAAVTEPAPDISQAASQLADPAQGPSVGGTAKQSGDFDGMISPAQGERAASEDPESAVGSVDPAEAGNGETAGCAAHPPADDQNAEDEPSAGAGPGKPGEDHAK